MFQFVPSQGRQRAAVPDNDDTGRFTSMLACAASGAQAPPAFIIKCSTIDNNQDGKIKVIDTLHAQPGYTAADGWVSGWWSGPVATKTHGIKDFKRQYLRHTDGRVIWAQHKAYMDSCGMCMWVDLVLGPLKFKSGHARWLMVWDSCASHTTTTVLEKMAAWGIDVMQLPVNMTDLLQVLDLVINGPLKRCTRRLRARALYNYFQSWRSNANAAVLQARKQHDVALSAASKAGKPPPRWVPAVLPLYKPPKPTMLDGLKCVADAFKSFGASAAFTEGVQRSFRNVGLAPVSGAGYIRYPDSHEQAKVHVFLADRPGTLSYPAGDVIDDFCFERPSQECEEAAGVDSSAAGAAEGGAVAGEGEEGGGASAQEVTEDHIRMGPGGLWIEI